MLVYASKIIGAPVLSVQAGGPIGAIESIVVDPDNLNVIAFKLGGASIGRDDNYILDVRSVREYSQYGFVIDDIDELVAPGDVLKIANVLEYNFSLINLKVETRKGSKLGKIIDYTLNSDNFMVQQIVVKRPAIKALIDPELLISRNEVVEVNDYKLIVKDEEKVIKEKAEKEDFVPNFVNPFREQGFAPVDTKSPDERDKQ